MSVRLGRFMKSIGLIPTTQVAYRNGLDTCDAFLCVSHTLQSHWRVARRLGLCILISEQPLIGSTIREFDVSSVLWVLEVLCFLY